MEAASNIEVEARSPPIHNLDEDLLLNIFMINANMDEDPSEYRKFFQDWGPRALTVTRNTSHVCSFWRQAMLSSPSLWGRLVDLDYLILLKKEWREEIMRRTGTSLLHVKNTHTTNWYIPTFLPFLAYVLDVHWARIEILDVSTYFEGDYKGDLWYPIARPSKALKAFRVALGALQQPIQSGETLFGNDAPRLREVQLIARFQANLYLSSSWLSQLCHLEVSGAPPTSRPTLLAWLEKLADMPFLRILRLYSAFNSVFEDRVSLPVIELPNLTKLQVKQDLYSAALFLNHIKIPAKCRMCITISGIFTTPKFPSRDHLIVDVLSKYSKRWFSANTEWTNLALNLKVMLWQSLSIVQFEENALEHDSTGSAVSKVFEASVNVGDDDVEILELLPYFSVFSQCNFSHITMLSIRLTFSLDMAPAAISHLQNIISHSVHALPEVEALATSMELISQLTKLPRDADMPTPFPKLKVLTLYDTFVIREWDDTGEHPNPGREVAELFFRQRQEDGCPIQVLDLTACEYSTSPDMSYLENVEGMKVKWLDSGGSRQEAICGSGRVAQGLGQNFSARKM
ncbi:hypothetical protein NLJ89_g8484 [Agrocybe chaxingu]|uniref:F-box domain-containing protein n=1 Tax=Agrocybe chaxingu TaxID=84603 RepID=A0A9W8MQQ7_9AGAR|nr:hypothetical protein NLJ89_g8484 [Agrocybe chaxingu]